MKQAITFYGFAVVSIYNKQPSHDWGGEFYHNETEAHTRANELNGINKEATFGVRQARFIIENL